MTQAAGAAPTSALREAQPSNLFLLRLREAVEAVGLLAPVADAQYSSVLEANLAMELRQWLFHTARFPFAQVALDFTVSGDATAAESGGATSGPVSSSGTGSAGSMLIHLSCPSGSATSYDFTIDWD